MDPWHLCHQVLIDEAAQAEEVAALQPLVHGAAGVVLVGDPQQLPATVFSSEAREVQFERSLFERLQQVRPVVPGGRDTGAHVLECWGGGYWGAGGVRSVSAGLGCAGLLHGGMYMDEDSQF
jgi:hypothetical protein